MKKIISKFSIIVLLATTNIAVAEQLEPIGQAVKNLPWIEIRVPYNMKTSELAGIYYSDENDYTVIYNANRGRIPSNMYLRKGMSLVIPVTEKFKDYPEKIGWN